VTRMRLTQVALAPARRPTPLQLRAEREANRAVSHAILNRAKVRMIPAAPAEPVQIYAHIAQVSPVAPPSVKGKYPRATCVHEAGHAVAALKLFGGFGYAQVAPKGTTLKGVSPGDRQASVQVRPR
jgi:hypothetical protein